MDMVYLKATYLKATAAAVGLEISGDNQPGVMENLDRIAAIADFLMRFPLAQDIEVAPVFRP
jgi:hypothetical protein